MGLISITSPHAYGKNSTAKVMQIVLLATVPGIIALTYSFGWGFLTNIFFACLFALILEACAVKIRKQPVNFFVSDYTAIVTAVLLGVALPPFSAWWLILVGMLFSIIIAKHLYGGIGNNPFNPAMVGYVVLLISFPVEMTRWASPLIGDTQFTPSLFESFKIALGFSNYPIIDSFTSATPLDLLRQNNALMVDDLRKEYAQFGFIAGKGWEIANIAFLIGGLFLLYKKIYTWHAPVSMLVALFIMSALFYDNGSSASIGSPIMQLFSGATMLGAWFIVTDPVSSATSNKGRIIFGAMTGLLIFIIRKWGNYPDAVAFSVLLMNFAAPLIDHYTQPKTYGH